MSCRISAQKKLEFRSESELRTMNRRGAPAFGRSNSRPVHHPAGELTALGNKPLAGRAGMPGRPQGSITKETSYGNQGIGKFSQTVAVEAIEISIHDLIDRLMQNESETSSYSARQINGWLAFNINRLKLMRNPNQRKDFQVPMSLS